MLKGKIRVLVNANAIQFGVMPGRGTTETFLLWKECKRNKKINKEKTYKCFVVIEKPFHRAPRKVIEWAMKKEPSTKVIMITDKSVWGWNQCYLKKFGCKLVSTKYLLYIVFTSFRNCNRCNCWVRKRKFDTVDEILYADNLILKNESFETFRDKFWKHWASLRSKKPK